MKKPIRSKFRPEYPVDFVFDYKDPVTLNRFLMDGGKIVPARISKLSLAQQRKLAAAVKRSRSIALIPYGMEAHDLLGRPEPISAKPFEV